MGDLEPLDQSPPSSEMEWEWPSDVTGHEAHEHSEEMMVAAVEEQPPLERGHFLHADFGATCRLAARLGAAAMNNGSMAENVERFLPKLMAVYGYYGFFSISTFELSCNFEKEDPLSEEIIVRTQNVAIEAGSFQLTRLGHLSDLAKDVVEGRVDIREASQRLDQIENSPNPWGPFPVLMAFLGTSAALPALLNGTWWNLAVGPFAAAMTFSLIFLFKTWQGSRIRIWLNLLAAFLCSTLGFVAQLVRPEIDPTIVTLSGVAFLLPSSTIVLGINDCVASHVIMGFERMVKGLIILCWLALGYFAGMSVVGFLAPDRSEEVIRIRPEIMAEAEPIPELLKLLLIPVLCCGLAIGDFQMSGFDLIGAVICMVVGYVTSYFCFHFLDKESYVGTFMGSLAVSLYANIWSRYYDRPNTIILFPAFQLLVAGMTGFMGITELVQGTSSMEDGVGNPQIFHMFAVAGIIVIGFLVGATVVQPYTTI